jgi:hypothetical protein
MQEWLLLYTEDNEMKMNTMKPVLHSFAYSLEFLREQAADVNAADMVAQPSGILNHLAWTIGHLTVTCQKYAVEMLRDAQSRITRAVDQLDDSQLDEPFPHESYRDVFPTIRHALTQVLVGHTAFHVGQVSVWRKAMGLPPMGRSFE